MTDVFTGAESGKPKDNTVITVNDLVGEGKKFKTVDDLAKGKAESDAFINQLQEEMKALRNEVEKRNTAEANLESLRAEIREIKAKPVSSEASPNTTGALTAEQLENLVASTLTKQERERMAAQNLKTVNDKLVQTFGSSEKASEVLSKKAYDIGMSIEELRAIAAKSPSALLKLIGSDSGEKKADGVDPLNTNTKAENVKAGGAEPPAGSHAWYQALRRKVGNEKFYSDKKLQQQMWQDKKSGKYDAAT